jgi:hypothetical protein
LKYSFRMARKSWNGLSLGGGFDGATVSDGLVDLFGFLKGWMDGFERVGLFVVVVGFFESECFCFFVLFCFVLGVVCVGGSLVVGIAAGFRSSSSSCSCC